MARVRHVRSANGLQYFLTDHLGSTVAVTNASGTLTSQQRYLPFGGVRTNVTTPNSQFAMTDLGYTGQRALDPGMGGLMDYHARFYSPMLGRFTQPDTITPNMTQGLNRYSYVGNSPIIFTDPSGHRPVCDEPSECKRAPKSSSLLIFKADDGQNWTDQEKKILEKGANDIAKALARDINSENRLLWKMGEIDQYQRITSTQAFNNVFGGPIVVRRSGSDCDCWAQHMNKQDGQHYEIWIFSTTSAEDLISHPYLIVHEIGHAFNAAVGGQPAYSVPGSLFRDTNSEGIIGTDIDGNFYGYHGAHFQWQFGKTAGDAQGGEEFADMFVGWTYGKWENSSMGINRQNFMNSLMVSYLSP